MAIVTKSGSKTRPREVIERAKAEGVEVVDVRFIDLPGTWQHFSLPIGELEEDSFTEGLGFDGSSIRGFQAIDESDMLLMPDPDSATIDPCLSHTYQFDDIPLCHQLMLDNQHPSGNMGVLVNAKTPGTGKR